MNWLLFAGSRARLVRARCDTALISAERDIELFAGPGGFSEGAARLGIRAVGIEWDDAACATRRARRHDTLQADVAALDPMEFAPVRLMIAAPPCQAFSMAGLGAGRDAIDVYLDAIARWMEGKPPSREELDEQCSDDRAHLVLEVLRWALALRPQFIACEQVKEVLPLWEAIAGALRSVGYGTWTGILTSERYGVPQTRKRAILMAELGGQPSEPPATHARYVAPRVKPAQEESLFKVPEPERIVLAGDRELRPWVSMAEALGWDGGVYANGTHEHRAERPMSEPAPTVMFGDRLNTVEWRPDDQVGFPRRADTPSNHSSGSVEIGGVDYRERDFRSASEPAFTVTEKARSAIRMRANAQDNAAVRSADEPPTHMNTGRDWKQGGSREDAQKVPVSEPPPAFTGKLGGQAHWVQERPATTVAGDPRVFPPGHKLNEDDLRAGRGGQRRSGAGFVTGLKGIVSADASSPQADAGEILRALQDALGEEAFAEWRLGVPDPLQPPAVLRQDVHGGSQNCAVDPDDGEVRTPAGEDAEASWSLRAMRCAERAGRSSSQRESAGQLARELAAALSAVPREEASPQAVRVSIAEASILQGFPPDYPWQGTRTAQYRQIGDAVPPPLAQAILRHLLHAT